MMRFITKCAVLLAPALALATPAFALLPANLSDSQQPGSLIVFPKFVGGTPGDLGFQPQVHVGGQLVSRTEIEIGAVCPPLAGFVGDQTPVATCSPHQAVTVAAHWVCPGAEGVNSNICQEEDFFFTVTTNGKVVFSADGIPVNSNTPSGIPAPPCPRGYLVVYVVNPNTLQPIDFDALIGDAIIRGPDNLVTTTEVVAGASTAVNGYNGITIQALGIPGVVGPGLPLTHPLEFGVLGGYAGISAVQAGHVKFDRPVTAASPLPDVLSETFINFLTLDVVSGSSNTPTRVPLLFYNESATASGIPGGGEHETSTDTTFVCWVQVGLTTATTTFLGTGTPGVPTEPINLTLTQAAQGTREGLVLAGPAAPLGAAPDAPGTTLIALVETIEGTATNNYGERKYNYTLSTDGVVTITTFTP
jgi:hypothetical protein